MKRLESENQEVASLFLFYSELEEKGSFLKNSKVSIFVSFPTIYDCLERSMVFIFSETGTLKVKPLLIVMPKED